MPVLTFSDATTAKPHEARWDRVVVLAGRVSAVAAGDDRMPEPVLSEVGRVSEIDTHGSDGVLFRVSEGSA